LFFHSGATEGLFTLAHSFASLKRPLLICTSPVDHPAASVAANHSWGSHVETFELKLKGDLTYDLDLNLSELKIRKEKNPELIILYHHLWVHNETGLVSPLGELSRLKTVPDLFIHVDAVQAPGKIPDWQILEQGDAWTFSAHKFGALKGIGFTIMRSDCPFIALFQGGGQQSGLRGGTENPMGILSICLALEDLKTVDISKTRQVKSEIEKLLEQKLKDHAQILKVSHSNSNTIYFYFHQISSDISLALFDLNGLMISAGSACSSGAARPSAVLTQIGLRDKAKNGLRISLPLDCDLRLVDQVNSRLEAISEKLHNVL